MFQCAACVLIAERVRVCLDCPSKFSDFWMILVDSCLSLRNCLPSCFDSLRLSCHRFVPFCVQTLYFSICVLSLRRVLGVCGACLLNTKSTCMFLPSNIPFVLSGGQRVSRLRERCICVSGSWLAVKQTLARILLCFDQSIHLRDLLFASTASFIFSELQTRFSLIAGRADGAREIVGSLRFPCHDTTEAAFSHFCAREEFRYPKSFCGGCPKFSSKQLSLKRIEGCLLQPSESRGSKSVDGIIALCPRYPITLVIVMAATKCSIAQSAQSRGSWSANEVAPKRPRQHSSKPQSYPRHHLRKVEPADFVGPHAREFERGEEESEHQHIRKERLYVFPAGGIRKCGTESRLRRTSESV